MNRIDHRRRMAPASTSRRGNALAIIIGCLVIVSLVGLGLWMVWRLSSRLSRESQQQSISLNNDLRDSIEKGLEESQRADELDSADVASAPDDPTIPDDRIKMNWLDQVNTFIARELLATAEPDREATTLHEVLDRAALALDDGAVETPAVEGALRTTLASSYLNLGLVDDAALQGVIALDTLVTGFGEHHAYVAQARRNLGALRMHQGRFDEAADLFQSAHEFQLATGGTHAGGAGGTGGAGGAEDAGRIVDVILLLRDAAASHPPPLPPDTSDDAWPDSIRQLLEQTPPCCSLKSLEF